MKLTPYFLLHPMTWFVIGCFFLWNYRKRLSNKKRQLFIAVLGACVYATTTPFIPRILNVYLEGQHPPLVVEQLDSSKSYHIIVLGGGMGYDDRLPATSLLEPGMLARLVEGFRVYRALPNSLMVTSGYSEIGRTSQGAVAREAAIILGVDKNRVVAQTEPSNTLEEAKSYVKKFGLDNNVIIATSAIHIPRSIFLFKKLGVKSVIAAPSPFKTKLQNPYTVKHFLFPKIRYWGDIYDALYEIVGLVWAKIVLN